MENVCRGGVDCGNEKYLLPLWSEIKKYTHLYLYIEI